MASELKPWRYEIKYGPEGEDAYSWVYDDHGAMVATMKTHKAKQIVDAMNTRPVPAATDTGLVTIGGINLASGEMISCKDFDDGNPLHIPCCRKDRAEELLAAERAAQQRLLDIIEEANDNKEALEAKLASAENALTVFLSEYDELYLFCDEPASMVSAVDAARAVLGGKPS